MKSSCLTYRETVSLLGIATAASRACLTTVDFGQELRGVAFVLGVIGELNR